jgi:3-deoxy-D-manno-octulosonic acid (KDO) 8-phosphate synthase
VYVLYRDSVARGVPSCFDELERDPMHALALNKFMARVKNMQDVIKEQKKRATTYI